MKTIDTSINEDVNDPMDGATGMEDDLIAMPVTLLAEPQEPGQNKFFELGRADEKVNLGAEIIPEKETIDQITGQAEKSFVRFEVEFANALGHRFDNTRMGRHLDEIGFHTEKVHDIMKKGTPEAARPVNIASLSQRFQARLEIKVVEARPVVLVDVARRLASGQRAGLTVGPFLPPQVKNGFPLRMTVRRGEVLCCLLYTSDAADE